MYNEIVRVSDIYSVVEDYEHRKASLPSELAEYEKAASKLKGASVIQNTMSGVSIQTGFIHLSTLEKSLRISAWRYMYNALNLEQICSAKDRSVFEQGMQNPPEFTAHNIKATFGQYVYDPWGNILRGLAEVFSGLDPYYKSHERVKIGVKGLPKRVILSGFGGYHRRGEERVGDIMKALSAYRGDPLPSFEEIKSLCREGKEWKGLTLKTFKNGNGHLFFDPQTLEDVNKALAEYYGDVLPDTPYDRPSRPQASKEVSKDLQYYPTPEMVVYRVLNDIYIRDTSKVLEPSCGCGRFLDQIRKKTSDYLGIECDMGRVMEARSKGHNVYHGNFLEAEPNPVYDFVIMNPPFYGRHYVKHLNHAKKFLAPRGTLISILPATAWYDHGEIVGGRWYDLPVGSFSESGTNVNTGVWSFMNRRG